MALIPIVVLAGQSNAALAGIDNRLFELLSGEGGAFELVKVAEGGTSLYPDPAANDWDPTSGELFDQLVAAVVAAIQHVIDQGHTPVVSTLWIQGEADRAAPHASLYGDRLVQFIDAYRAAIGIADSPFFISMLQSGAVRDGQIAASEARENVELIETLGLTYWDGIHYDRPSRLAIAERYMAQSGILSETVADYVDLRAPLSIVDLGDGRDEVTAPLFADFIYTHTDRPARIFSFSGDDQITTGAGNDFISTGGNDDIVWAGAGNDRVVAGVHDDQVHGEAGNDILSGHEGTDLLDGGDGDDSLNGGGGADTMAGGSGNDKYTVDQLGDATIELEGEGTDEVHTPLLAFTIGDHIERLVGTRINMGQALTGNALDNVIVGGAFADTLDGKVGADEMQGGLGDDSYVVDNVGDRVRELAGGGIDHVRTALFAYTLDAEIERLTGTGTGAQMLTGNDLANTLTGGIGSDILNGAGGGDTMAGGKGHDIYVVDDAADTVAELAGEGVDEVRSTLASYVLPAEVERLTGLAGTGQSLTGNALANAIVGGEGADIIDAGAGDDRMSGFGGNDVYVVDSIADVVDESVGGGVDEVRSALAAYTLGAEIENLAGLSDLGQTLTGNATANVITAGAGSDIVDGGAGADTMAGGAGDDHYLVDDAADAIVEAAEGGIDEARTSIAAYTISDEVERLIGLADTGQALTGSATGNMIVGAAGDDVLAGLGGNDWLDGGAGSDTMTGGAGDDVFLVDIAGDNVVELVGEGIDQVRTALSAYGLAAEVEHLVGTSDLGQQLTGNAGDNIIQGGGGDDVLDGGAGNDLLDGGIGIDTVSYATAAAGVTYRMRGGSTQNTEGSGVDSLVGIENLVGSAFDDVLNGDLGNNRIEGGDGNDALSGINGVDLVRGGGGNDMLAGGIGDDLLEGESGTDMLVGGSGSDKLLGGADGDTLLGGTNRDTLDAGEGDDIIEGGRQRDTLTGGEGADTFVFRDDDTTIRAALADRITDFASGDRIDLSGMQADGPDAFTFIDQAAFSADGIGGELRYRHALGNTYLEGDNNGDGTVDFTIRVDGMVTFVPSDFVL